MLFNPTWDSEGRLQSKQPCCHRYAFSAWSCKDSKSEY